MMWRWHFKNLNDYASKAGNYSKLDKGLTEEEMDVFCFEAARSREKTFLSPPNEPPKASGHHTRHDRSTRSTGPDSEWAEAALVWYS